MNTTHLPVQTVIKQRAKARLQRERKQLALLDDRFLHKQTIEAKLIGIASGTQTWNFNRCGNEELFKTCEGCGRVEHFFYACNRKWCPLCARKLARIRTDKLRLWARTINQPKHLVLTMRNFPVLTRPKIRQFQKALLALRRQKIWSPVNGGCATLEITHSQTGWHLHAHILLDVRWLDMTAISQQWGHLVNQEFGIVKVKDCRGQDYLHEVSKYVAKGSEIASWPPEQIWEFICAIKGCRFFFAFGSLFKLGGEIKRELHRLKGGQQVCECGCGRFIIETESQDVENQINRARGCHRKVGMRVGS
jgi:hypothetical protein